MIPPIIPVLPVLKWFIVIGVSAFSIVTLGYVVDAAYRAMRIAYRVVTGEEVDPLPPLALASPVVVEGTILLAAVVAAAGGWFLVLQVAMKL